ncbi:hypothetical protein [Nitrobacter sp.]|jgi:hypothetical protein|uniref:hypothetical protein n=1 Tax=Nitrobacter sp. TaxID=29420 RepID=UPI003F64C004
MRLALVILGLLAILMGLVWAGQGTGVFPYPASSIMIRQTQWVWYGGAVAVAGLLALLLSRRL